MKEGKKEKIFKCFFNALRSVPPVIIKKFPLFNDFPFWIKDYLLLNTVLFLNDKNQSFFLSFEPKLDENNNPLIVDPFFFKDEKFIDRDVFFKNNIIKKLISISPIFAYFIYSVDKNIKKFSRGKSGKYVFIWKYIAPYKRSHISLKWLAKELKFNNEKTFSKRIIKTFLILTNNMESTFSWKSKNFSHNYVFRNFKKTLMTNLKTTT